MTHDTFTVVWKKVSNEGECYDDDENFCGHKTLVTIEIITGVKHDKVGAALESIFEIAPDYGDGVSCGRVLAVYDEETKESQPIDLEYWGVK